MNNLLKINFQAEHPTVSARELHNGLEIGTKFTTWFQRITEYGFLENQDFQTCFPNLGSELHGGQNMVDYQISIDMAKQICMLQRTEQGRLYRQYFLDLEKAWNTPEQIFARALKMADKEIDKLKNHNAKLLADNEEMKPKALFADAVSASKTSILIGELAKILKQNDVNIGQNRLFAWMRDKGYLIKSGERYNQPTQYSMERGLFELKERVVTNPDGSIRMTITTKVTGKGQQYFINLFLKNDVA